MGSPGVDRRARRGRGARVRRSEAMGEHDPRLLGLISEARERRYSRRDVVRRGLALGFAVPAITAAWRAEHALGQEGPVQVAILNREMTKDEIAAEIANEGEVNVGNW